MQPQLDQITEEQIEIIAGQTLAYGFLNKALYTPPTADLLNTLASQNLFAEWPLPADQTATQQGLELLRTYCANWNESQMDALTEDYNRLFVGPDRLPAPPWESVYRSPDHLLFDTATIQVRDLYQQYGVKAPRQNNEPDDHVGLEMAFMVHLSQLALQAIDSHNACLLDRAVQGQRAFLTDHLLAWIPRYAQDVITSAQTDYYRGVAYLLLGTLAETAALLKVSTEVTA
ncbi:MAG: molecular chaperone TorD family protein [Anaerolineae bacterium]|nr:molecular chaperone TorD family protein [Anaerolineae bacterium]